MFCRHWTGTHALIKPTQVLRPPPMARQRIRGFAIACSCHFHRPSSSASRAVLALFGKSTATPCRHRVLEIACAQPATCFLSLRNGPNAGGYPRASQAACKNNMRRFRQCDRRRREADSVHHSSRALAAVSATRSGLLWTRAMAITTERRSRGGLRIAHFSLQCGRADCCGARSLVDRSFARSSTVSARLLGHALPNTLR